MSFLDQADFITFGEALDFGLSKMALSRMVKEGTLQRPFRSIYCKSVDWLAEPLRRYAAVCTLYPHAIICGISALIFYGLTDEFERQVWIAYPNARNSKNQEFHMVYLRENSYQLGVIRHKVGKREVRIYDREKSVVDAFKLLPIDVAHKVLRNYLKLKDADLGKLSWYGKKLRKPIDQEINILLSDE